jgi:hypothetical protein
VEQLNAAALEKKGMIEFYKVRIETFQPPPKPFDTIWAPMAVV